MSGRHRRLRDRISRLVMLVSAIAIIGVAVTLAALNHRNLKQATFAALQAQTDTAALNSGAPLVFGDRATATEVLEAFRAIPSVSAATLYRTDGVQFARYRRDAGAAADHDSLPLGLNPRGAEVVSVTTVEEKGQTLGRLQVVYDLSALNHQLWQSLAFAALCALVAILLASLVSRHLAAVMTQSLARLTDTARRVSDTGDYGLRAPEGEGDDEIDAFTRTFNAMLGEIERQDREVKASRAQAEAASLAKDEFLATLSHELRTPMTPILGWAQILERVAQGQPQVLQAAQVIERNALAQTRIIDDLLDMSRIISGKIRLDMQPVRIQDVLSGALDAVRGAAEARSLVIGVEMPSDPPPVRADPHRLQQVLWNLLSNAIKFTDPGGQVRVRVQQRDAQLEITVSDSGRGIAAEFLPYVFERFRQADASITREHGGLGLGLAIVKQIVELHGGTVSVASSGSGHGASFSVHLPVRAADAPSAQAPAATPAKPAAPVAPPPSTPEPLRALRLLVVDNEADARQWLQQVLAAHGARVLAAGSAEEALQSLQAAPTDVLVSDIGMPGTDGYALIRQVRALPDCRDLPAIALTAFARPEDRARALDAGYQMHLGKPVDLEALVAAVQSLAPAAAAASRPR